MSESSSPDQDHHRPGHQHDQGVSADADGRWLSLALAAIALFMVAEVAVSVIAHSLALLSDAAHMLTDVATLALALVAMRLAKRPAEGRFTYGFKRVEILSAQANGLTLLILGLLLAIEAIRRLVSPSTVTGSLVLTVALIGVVVNLGASWSISRANRTSLNVEGAFQHILTDLFGFTATAVAGLVIILTSWERADAVASLFVVLLMVRAGVGLVRDSGRIFMEAAPLDVDPAALGAALAAVHGVAEVHDLHVWEITSGMPAVSAHVIVEPDFDCHGVQRDVQRVLHDQHHIAHTTLQVEHASDGLLQIGSKRDDPRHDRRHR
jgi:cobalt-zinc-cadmium efflux system protein